jgi:hypothetical protein
MGTSGPESLGHLERPYVAYCLATEIVRVRRSAAKLRQANPQARELTPLLTQPLEAVAAQLGLTEAVAALVRVALPGAEAPAATPVPAPPARADADAPGEWLRVRGTNGTQRANGASSTH